MTPYHWMAAFGLAALAACSQPDPVTTSKEMAGTDAPARSCVAEIGREEARALVDQCMQVSPATRPPCNEQNSCEMIRGEIARGCGFGGATDNPDFCAGYQ